MGFVGCRQRTFLLLECFGLGVELPQAIGLGALLDRLLSSSRRLLCGLLAPLGAPSGFAPGRRPTALCLFAPDPGMLGCPSATPIGLRLLLGDAVVGALGATLGLGTQAERALALASGLTTPPSVGSERVIAKHRASCSADGGLDSVERQLDGGR